MSQCTTCGWHAPLRCRAEPYLRLCRSSLWQGSCFGTFHWDSRSQAGRIPSDAGLDTPQLHAARSGNRVARTRFMQGSETDCPACSASGLLLAHNRGWPDLRPHFFGGDRQNACVPPTAHLPGVRRSFGCRHAVVTLSLAEWPISAVYRRFWILVLVRRRPGGTRPFSVKVEGLCQTTVHHLFGDDGVEFVRPFESYLYGENSSCSLRERGTRSSDCAVALRLR